MKVQRAAEKQDIAPKTFCDTNAETFKALAKKVHLANDHFIRTTDPDHIEAVQHFWKLLRENGHIYETTHTGWYAVSDECFYPEELVERSFDPQTGKTFMASSETGSAVEWVEEKNYHFRMTALKDRLLQFYKENPEWVVPAARMADVVNWVENNLEDLSISRPISRLDWGVPVPDDPEQTVYVWVDALTNYVTKAGFPHWKEGSEHEAGWPADVHVVGKDIVRFHAIYWPALLMAVGLPLPKRILSHAHWTLGQKKMSKSTGNVVNPFFAVDRWGVDTMRYFLIYNGGIANDSDYGNHLIVERYKKGLQGGLGNLLNRITRPKQWNVESAVNTCHSKGDELSSNRLIENLIEKQRQFLEAVPARVAAYMDQLDPPNALREIMELVFETNKYVSETAPWVLAKAGPQEAETLRRTVFYAS